jgi:hypothetical protein
MLDLATAMDAVYPMRWFSASVLGLKADGIVYTSGIYTVRPAELVITFRLALLLGEGTHTVKLLTDCGEVTLTLTVDDTRAPQLAGSSAADYTVGGETDIFASVYHYGRSLTVSLAGKTLNAEQYAFDEKTGLLKFSRGYLDALGKGNHVFELSTQNGTVQYTVNVYAEEAPKSPAGYIAAGAGAGIALSGSAFVLVYFILKKKKKI